MRASSASRSLVRLLWLASSEGCCGCAISPVDEQLGVEELAELGGHAVLGGEHRVDRGRIRVQRLLELRLESSASVPVGIGGDARCWRACGTPGPRRCTGSLMMRPDLRIDAAQQRIAQQRAAGLGGGVVAAQRADLRREGVEAGNEGLGLLRDARVIAFHLQRDRVLGFLLQRQRHAVDGAGDDIGAAGDRVAGDDGFGILRRIDLLEAVDPGEQCRKSGGVRVVAIDIGAGDGQCIGGARLVLVSTRCAPSWSVRMVALTPTLSSRN